MRWSLRFEAERVIAYEDLERVSLPRRFRKCLDLRRRKAINLKRNGERVDIWLDSSIKRRIKFDYPCIARKVQRPEPYSRPNEIDSLRAQYEEKSVKI
jgi:hypothetical protein